VIDFPGAGWDALAAAAWCARSIACEQRLLLIGDHQASADARWFGLEADFRVCPPMNRLAAGVGPLNRALRDIRAAWPVDALHTWSDSARVICREILAFDLPIVQEDPAPFATRHPVGTRAAARSALGIADHEAALLLASDRPGVGDTRRLAGLVGVLHLADFPTVGVACTRCDTFRRSARLLRGFGHGWDVIPLRPPPLTALAAADVVLLDQGDTLTADSGPGHPSGGVVFAAGAAGIPVVAVQSPLVRRLLGPLCDTLCAKDGSLPELARVALPLCTDAAARARAGSLLRQRVESLGLPDLPARWIAAASMEVAA